MKIRVVSLVVLAQVLIATHCLAQIGFIFQPLGRSASPGADALFLGTAFGPEPLQYQWRKNGSPLPGANQDSLYLSNLGLSDAGDYDVVVTANSGSVTSDVAVLTIEATFTKIMNDPVVGEFVNSSASAWGDFDNDGNLDVLVTHGGNGPNALFHNRGDGTFQRLNMSPVTTDLAPSTGALWADFDNDGWLDLVVINGANNTNCFYYHNNQGLSFTRITVGLGADLGSIQAAAVADYDRDGWLDLVAAPINAGFGGTTGGLYHNDHGTLTRNEISLPGLSTAQSVAWVDYDGDGDLDMFFAMTRAGGFFGNPTGNEILYLNNGFGAFTRQTNGVVLNAGGSSTTASWADYDGDGDLDVFIGNADGEVKFLFRNEGNGTFTQIGGEIADEEGAAESSAWADYDNDGWIDLFVANNMGGGNFLFHNLGNGFFAKEDMGSVTSDRANSVSACWADINNDGFPDLFVTNFGENNYLYRNNGNDNGWISVRVFAYQRNRDAVGARVRVLANISGVDRWQMREIGIRDSSGSPNTVRAEFGLGDATIIKTLRIDWPSGQTSELHDIAPRQFLSVVEPPSIVNFGGQGREGDSGTRNIYCNVQLQAPNANTVSVDYFTVDGTAIAGTHYIATNGTISFGPGETNRNIAVAVIGNEVDDSNRVFYVTLTNAVNMAISVATAPCTIIDDDPLALTVDNASVLEGNSGTTALVFNVSLNKPSDQPVSLAFWTVGSSGVVDGRDYEPTNGILVLLPGEETKAVPVTVYGDLLNEPNEVVFFNMSNVVGAVQIKDQASGTIIDDDPLPVMSVTSTPGLEGSTGTNPVVFTFNLSPASGRTVSVAYTTSNGVARAALDFTTQSGTLTFTPGITSRTVSVPIRTDDLPEGSENFYMLLSSPVNCVLVTNVVIGTILDDDFRVVSPGAGTGLGFISVSNRLHRVERTLNLMPPVNWVPVPGSESVLGNGSFIPISDPAAAAEPMKFYRVLLLP